MQHKLFDKDIKLIKLQLTLVEKTAPFISITKHHKKLFRIFHLASAGLFYKITLPFHF